MLEVLQRKHEKETYRTSFKNIDSQVDRNTMNPYKSVCCATNCAEI